MTVAIVDYGSGNLHSAAKAFERAARESGRDQPIVVTRDPDAVRRADRIVLPGVGAFADCRRGLDAVEGMIEALEETVRGRSPRCGRTRCSRALRSARRACTAISCTPTISRSRTGTTSWPKPITAGR